PDRVQHRATALPVTIQSVQADDRRYASGATLEFPAHTSTVQIAYTAISLSSPEGVRYRYRLDDADAAWREGRVASPVTYRNLYPGHYHFRVEASDTNGAWTGQQATLAFTLLPAFYQTAWFRTLVAGAALGLIWIVFQLRVRQVRREVHAGLEARL